MCGRVDTVEDPAEGLYYATVASHGDNRIKLHSRVSKYVEWSSRESFLDTLRLSTNQNMRDFVYLYSDGEWITEAILNNILDVLHDGSY